MRRTLVLDDDDLIMVVDKAVTRQIDENRGEMNRTEFVNFLIQSQLKEYNEREKYADKEEFHRFAQGITELLRNFLEFFLSHGLRMEKQQQDKSFDELSQYLQMLNSFGRKDSTI